MLPAVEGVLFMRITSGAAARRRATVVTVLSAALAVGACSGSDRFPGPSWNLTGGKTATPLPPRPIYAEPPRQAALPPSLPHEQPTLAYRDGRDPITGRAPTFGAPPVGLQQQQPAAVPETRMPSLQPAPASRPPPLPQSQQSSMPTVEVRPGQSLAGKPPAPGPTQRRILLAVPQEWYSLCLSPHGSAREI